MMLLQRHRTNAAQPRQQTSQRVQAQIHDAITSGPKGVVAVVGAGPAGLLAAMLLAKRNYQVQIFEKRGDPRSAEALSTTRMYPMSISARAAGAFRAAGATPAFMAPDRKPLAAWLINGKPMPGMQVKDAGIAEQVKLYVTDRLTLARDLTFELERLWPASSSGDKVDGKSCGGGDVGDGDEQQVALHFDHALQGIDFEQHSVTFTGPQGQDVKVQYDLLIGADGASSAVRSALQQHDPTLKVKTLLDATDSNYKTFSGLPATMHLDIDTSAAAASKSQEGGKLNKHSSNGVAQSSAADTSLWELVPGISSHAPGEYLYSFRGAKLPGAAISMGVTVCMQTDGSLSGLLRGAPAYNADVLHAAFQAQLPFLPDPWVNAVVSQTSTESSQAPSTWGRVIQCSHFHGPRTVLLGDAAHAVTSGIGQGCNTACESALVLADVMDACGQDLDAVPQRFTEARRADAHALQHLELTYASTLVNDVKLPFLFKLYGRALLMTNFLLGGLLNKLVPSVMPLGSPLFKDVRDPRVSFSKALRSAQLMLAGMVLGVTLGVAKLVL